MRVGVCPRAAEMSLGGEIFLESVDVSDDARSLRLYVLIVTSPLEFKTSVSNSPSPIGIVDCDGSFIPVSVGSNSELAPSTNAPSAR